MISSPFGALSASAATTPSFQNPVFVVVWLSIGVVGLVVGLVAVRIAVHRRRSEPVMLRTDVSLAPVESELLSAA